ncbi:hypothetical protein CLOP_g18914 [Closterium sp. NIES-67]|nr:hypothetical protein CLOP_g18914 [Closterium sp. NIES-67]
MSRVWSAIRRWFLSRETSDKSSGISAAFRGDGASTNNLNISVRVTFLEASSRPRPLRLMTLYLLGLLFTAVIIIPVTNRHLLSINESPGLQTLDGSHGGNIRLGTGRRIIRESGEGGGGGGKAGKEVDLTVGLTDLEGSNSSSGGSGGARDGAIDSEGSGNIGGMVGGDGEAREDTAGESITGEIKGEGSNRTVGEIGAAAAGSYNEGDLKSAVGLKAGVDSESAKGSRITNGSESEREKSEREKRRAEEEEREEDKVFTFDDEEEEDEGRGGGGEGGRGGQRAGLRGGASAEVQGTTAAAYPSVERIRTCEGVAEDDIVLRRLLSPTPFKLTPKTLPSNLVLSFALGLSATNLSALATSFRKFVLGSSSGSGAGGGDGEGDGGSESGSEGQHRGALLVFFVQEWPKGWKHQGGVALQTFCSPEEGKWSSAHATNLRYRAFHLFLRSLDFEGTVILADPTDVLLLANPFPTLNDMSFHLYTGSAVYPTHGIRFLPPEHKRLAACYGTRLAFSLANSRIITSGFVAGTLSQVQEFLIQVIEDFERLPEDCMALEESDEAVVNHLVRSGRLKEGIESLRVEDAQHGNVLHRFSAEDSFELKEDGRVVNAMGRTVVAIHGYDNFIDSQLLVKDVTEIARLQQ